MNESKNIEKLSALAHELNNALSVSAGNIMLLNMKFSKNNDIPKDIKDMVAAMNRGTEKSCAIVNEMRASINAIKKA